MSEFLNDQLDFIFFFYGLAFLLLGATSSAIARRRADERHWTLLAAFGLVHGLAEWLDLSALILGDSAEFAAVRISVMTASFVFLAEFGRLQMAGRNWIPGRWVYLPILGLIALVGYSGGLVEAGTASRYTLGFFGSLSATVALSIHASRLTGSGRAYSRAASIGFALYAVAAGAIVPAAPFWPANVVNYNAFSELTGVPIQLVRGLLACWIASAVWAIWGQQLASEVLSGSFSAYLRRQFIWTVCIISAILLSGWTLTEWLGDIYRHNVQIEAEGDIELLASRFAGELNTADALVKTLAASPSTQEALERGDEPALTRARAMLDLHVVAGSAEAGYLLNEDGGAIAVSGVLAQRPSAAMLERSYDKKGSALSGFVCDAVTRSTVYYTRRGITDDKARPIGTAVLMVSVEAFGKDLEGLNRPYYFVDPNGIVAMSNLRRSQHRTLWPISPSKQSALTARFGSLDPRPISREEIKDATWTEISGSREYVRRQFIADSDWSLIILKPTREIFATRFVGIIITLLVTIVALIYLLGKERWMHEGAQLEAQSKLRDIARDLNIKATTDPLTGLSNRLRLNDILPHEMARVDRTDSALSVVMYDIDRFKAINDRFGHNTGDKVLTELSGTVRTSLRASDYLIRWGGEEFLLVLPDTNTEEARHVAETLRKLIANKRINEVGEVTSSFGIAEYAPGEAMADLIARADQALYRAKSAGRNQVAVAPPPRHRRSA
ncbi:diguanylate cyclase (GGDEF)-like protein [Rhodoligotrophos appendicifer]|uniref:sensor domain-containing diguanylate cyclase n=1 Tax=Rhodoligotrophos appendicifer TaxID=987056 RepID=UPI001184FF0A|nr:sensor domain-containing diguanylate cyclase [Rhodoligotrophos appendicifer]